MFRCGVSRKKTEATSVLGESFAGIGVTDDYAAYKSLFSEHQLCWAHLIRKAIKLVLQNPDETRYAEFLDQLCAIYHDAKELRDNVAASVVGEPLNEASQRKAVVVTLQDRIQSLCSRHNEKIITEKAAARLQPPVEPTPSHIETFILLQRELANHVHCLFVADYRLHFVEPACRSRSMAGYQNVDVPDGTPIHLGKKTAANIAQTNYRTDSQPHADKQTP